MPNNPPAGTPHNEKDDIREALVRLVEKAKADYEREERHDPYECKVEYGIHKGARAALRAYDRAKRKELPDAT